MYCSHCGGKNDDNVRFCIGCGTSLCEEQQMPSVARSSTGVRKPVSCSRKNPILAMILSLVIVGAGQFYNNEYKKGILMLGAAVLFGLFSAGMLWFAVGIWSAYDAYTAAKAI